MPTQNTADIITDASGQVWTKEEVQALVNQVANFTKAASRLGLDSIQPLRSMGILTPAEYVKDKAIKEPEWLPRYVLMHGSTAAAATHLNVSIAHLEGVLKHLQYDVRLPMPDKNAVIQSLQKFGSVIYVARLFHTTPSMIKKAVPEWKNYQDATKAGDHSTKTGTIGELYFEKLRGDRIIDSPAKTNHNHKGFDYVDSEYGKVNVKAIPVNPRGKWTWEIDKLTACDSFALVQLDAGKTPVGMVVISKSQLNDPPAGLLSTPRSNGDIAISTVEQYEAAPVGVDK